MTSFRDNMTPEIWEAIHADEIARLAKTYPLSDDEARFVVRSRASGADVDQDAKDYVAMRSVRTIDDYERVRAELAQ